MLREKPVSHGYPATIGNSCNNEGNAQNDIYFTHNGRFQTFYQIRCPLIGCYILHGFLFVQLFNLFSITSSSKLSEMHSLYFVQWSRFLSR